jgi:hypothetical protein
LKAFAEQAEVGEECPGVRQQRTEDLCVCGDHRVEIADGNIIWPMMLLGLCGFAAMFHGPWRFSRAPRAFHDLIVRRFAIGGVFARMISDVCQMNILCMTHDSCNGFSARWFTDAAGKAAWMGFPSRHHRW